MTTKQRLISAATALSIFAFAVPALADTAPDATDFGPLETTSAEYKFDATIDPDIIGDRFTELWAAVYMPVDLSAGPYPLLVFKHGNHGTCGSCTGGGTFVGYECFVGEMQVPRSDGSSMYTTSGTCPTNFVVTPNHLGYGYLAERLASWGFIVVSINSNRGITAGTGVPGDAGLNLARGRLILKHLQRLSEWNTNPGTTPPDLGVDLFGKIDFNNVGLMGHSRGGEGVRAAYNLYRDSDSPWPAQIPDPVTFKAIFEIGAVDGQTARILNPDGTVWNQLLPMCDGDVSNLQGVKPFDRTMRIFTESPATQKSTFTVWGTNHNYYNTEWQISESGAVCTGAGNPPLFAMPLGSPAQRQASLASVMALFRGNVGVGADATFNRNFNPMFDLPGVVADVTRVDRGYTDSPASGLYPGAPTTVFEDFTQAAVETSEYGFTIDTFLLLSYTKGSVPNHDAAVRAALISWDTPGGFLETNWTDVDVGNDISGYATLDLRVSRQNSALNPPTPNITNFNIQLVMADGSASAEVPLSNYTQLTGPVGGSALNLHPILQTARIPLTDFFGADLTQIRGVSLNFDDTPSGAIYVANIRLSQIGAGTGANNPNLVQSTGTIGNIGSDVAASAPVYSDGNLVTQITQSGINGGVVVDVYSNTEIPITDELLSMQIGDQTSMLIGSPDGDMRHVAARFDAAAFAQVNSGDPITIRYGSNSPVWNFGLLDKRLVNK